MQPIAAAGRFDNLRLKPLLLIGFPRGITSPVYTLAQQATGLRELFGGVGDGEIFNPQRLEMLRIGATGRDQSGFYDRSEEGYRRVAAIAAHVKAGFIVKDVVQPFHVLRWLAEHPSAFNVLYVRRPLAHAAFAQRRQGWGYVHSVELLDEAFAAFPTLDTERMLFDGDVLFSALRSLGYHVDSFDPLTPSFVARRDGFYSDFAAFAGGCPETEAVPVLEPHRRYAAGDAGAILAHGQPGLRFRLAAPAPSLVVELATRDVWRLEVLLDGKRVERITTGRGGVRLTVPLGGAWHPHRIRNVALRGSAPPARWPFAPPRLRLSGFRLA